MELQKKVESVLNQFISETTKQVDELNPEVAGHREKLEYYRRTISLVKTVTDHAKANEETIIESIATIKDSMAIHKEFVLAIENLNLKMPDGTPFKATKHCISIMSKLVPNALMSMLVVKGASETMKQTDKSFGKLFDLYNLPSDPSAADLDKVSVSEILEKIKKG